MTSKKLLLTTFAIIGSMLLAQPNRSSAAQPNLPPALRAAVQSGNSSAITQAINTLAGGNPSRAAELALQVVSAAESMLSTNPQAAVSAASAAIGAIQNQAVMQASPQQSLDAATTAARIFASPAAQQAAPVAVAGLAIAVTTVVTNPAVYQSSPAAAIQAMANAYAAVTSSAVSAAAPGAAQQVGQTLTAASNSTSLAQMNGANAAQISAILAGQSSGNQQPNRQLPGNQNNDMSLTPPVDAGSLPKSPAGGS